VLLTPKWLLKRLPFVGPHEAYESWFNWRQYMNELFAQKVEETRLGKQSDGMDLLGSLVRSSYGQIDEKTGQTAGRAEKGEISKPRLSDSDILGNAFVMIIAGHETTANSIHFTLMLLAIAPKSQRQVQKEVQRIFGDKPPEKWDYESNINTLLGGIIGAVLNEQLRLMPPVINIPKCVPSTQDQVIVIDGKKHTLPAGAHININTVGVHRNPRYWPTEARNEIDQTDDLNSFKPERWLVKETPDPVKFDSATESSEDEFGGFTGRDTSAQLYRPIRGSYLPFSEGARSCVGRRLAQVKIMAVLAVIFQKYSIELAVDEWASDGEVAKMSTQEMRELYEKASKKASETLRSATTLITLKLHSKPDFVPVRLVRRGEERFVNILD